MKGFVIAGIGTDVGKTIISAIMVEALRADYWKPIQAGGLDFSDTDMVRSLVRNEDSQFLPEAYRLTEPMSPHAAAAIDGVKIELSQLQLPPTKNTLIVESAGGLMVPANEQLLNIDLIQHWELPVVLVSYYYLGSINHTLLSIEALKNRNIPISGIVFNGNEVPSTKEIILSYSGLPCLLELQREEELNPEVVSHYAAMIAEKMPFTR
jgi:dethiobiotin synthetase